MCNCNGSDDMCDNALLQVDYNDDDAEEDTEDGYV